jgi:hypothetical protein
MKRYQFLRLAYLASLLVVLPATLSATTVKKKNGEVLDGKILGMIVQREGKESSVSYTIRQGADITAIDERGVTFKKGSKVEMLSVFMQGKSADEIERLGGVGALVLRMSGKSNNVLDSNPLIGEYKGSLDKKEIKGAITGLIRIETKSGIVNLPVEEIVAFGEKK